MFICNWKITVSDPDRTDSIEMVDPNPAGSYLCQYKTRAESTVLQSKFIKQKIESTSYKNVWGEVLTVNFVLGPGWCIADEKQDRWYIKKKLSLLNFHELRTWKPVLDESTSVFYTSRADKFCFTFVSESQRKEGAEPNSKHLTVQGSNVSFLSFPFHTFLGLFGT